MLKKWLIGIGILLIASAAGAGGYYYWVGRAPAAEEASAVSRTAYATRGNIEVKVSGSGQVNANERASVLAGQAGTIAELGFREGDTVEKGQVLAVFEGEDLGNQISQKEISLKKQQLQLDQYEEQYKEAAAGEQDAKTLSSIALNMEVLKLEMKAAQEELAELREKQSEKKEIVAPISGVVTSSDLEEGGQVQANTVVAEIVNYESLTFAIQVDELDIPDIAVGQAAQVHLNALPDAVLEGTIESIAKEGTASGGVAAYEVLIALPEHEGVMTGMSGQADVITAFRENVVVVPVDAVIEMQGRTFVRMPGDGGATGADTDTDADTGADAGAGVDTDAGADAGTGADTEAGAGADTGTGGDTDAGAGADAGTGGDTDAGAGADAGAGGDTDAGARPGRQAAGAAESGMSESDDRTEGAPGAAAASAGRMPGGASEEAQGGTAGGRQSGTAGAAMPGGGAGGGMQGEFPGAGEGMEMSEEMRARIAERAAAGGGASGQAGAAARPGLGQMEGQLKEVTIGVSDETFVEIISGLNEGDAVLVPLPQGTVGGSSSSSQQIQFAVPGAGVMGGGSFSGGGGGTFSRAGAAGGTQGGGR